MSALWIAHQITLIVFLAVLLCIALSNLRALRRLGTYRPAMHLPRISVLVPARDEERNIEPCLRSLLAQDYADFEVLALDDGSADATPHIMDALAKKSPRLRVLQGRTLPPGWLGKHWACHQLAQAADGDLLLFTDADTRHRPGTLHGAVSALMAEGADLLTAIPHQEVATWSERLIVPLFPWSIFTFLPLALAHRWRWPAFSASVGQFMLFRRQAYETVGGHEAVLGEVVDDIALGRRVKALGLRWRLVDAGEHVRCRMYRGFREACNGFSKNLFAAFGHNVPVFAGVWLWLLLLFWEPLVVLGAGIGCASGTGLSLLLAGSAIVISLALWGLFYWRFDFPGYLTLFYPVTILLGSLIAARSMLLALTGRASWKGRRL